MPLSTTEKRIVLVSSLSEFSAVDSLLGYAYQIRLALLSSLQRLARGEVFTVYLETLDDVVFETENAPLELLQLKHHLNRAANLTDASPDLWKSFRVWIVGRRERSIPEDARLYLFTTSDIGEGSLAIHLMNEGRNEAEALRKLQETATTSTNQTNKPAYDLFRALSTEAQEKLVKAITICPNAPIIGDVTESLRVQARLVVKRSHLDSFLNKLEGWWYKRAIEHLIARNEHPILSNDIESIIDDLREQFKLDALPVDQDILDETVDVTFYKDRVFVRQVSLVGVRQARILFAIRDYYRAFTQRSRWVREGDLLVGELDRYEQFLQEEWSNQFERVADELGDDLTDEAKRIAAQKNYEWVEQSCYPIRPQVRHPSLTRGSFHILSDSLKVGWHPEFKKHLEKILQLREAS